MAYVHQVLEFSEYSFRNHIESKNTSALKFGRFVFLQRYLRPLKLIIVSRTQNDVITLVM